jgi:hypothetical protein
MLAALASTVKRWGPIKASALRITFSRRPADSDSTELQALTSERGGELEKATTSTGIPEKQSALEKMCNVPAAAAERIAGRKFNGWRAGVLHFALWASLVFLINLAATIWGVQSQSDVFVEGDCTTVKRLDSGLHVLINILSTTLLGGSNYCMQILSAPTRKDIDRSHAHSKPVSLDIGIPSIRNLTRVSRRRALLWCLLGISSLPLHLL